MGCPFPSLRMSIQLQLTTFLKYLLHWMAGLSKHVKPWCVCEFSIFTEIISLTQKFSDIEHGILRAISLVLRRVGFKNERSAVLVLQHRHLLLRSTCLTSRRHSMTKDQTLTFAAPRFDSPLWPAEAAVVEVLEACVKAWPDLHHHRLCVEVYFLSEIREQQKIFTESVF